MRLKPEDKARIGDRIVAAAAIAFRKRGIGAVTLDDLMNGAGLTRGAFYAHFRSKSDLVAEVLRRDHPILRMLQARSDPTPDALWKEMVRIFDGYLDPANLSDVHRGCTLAALTGEAARGTEAQRRGYDAALREIAAEMTRGLNGGADTMAAIVTASGAIAAAQACSERDTQAAILHGARRQVMAILSAMRP
ncbi:TetR/AcrR family transcriptional regulator [Jannaschia sp. S6380]|uniref:TetR/AcrR family transcriptional regulator n=1 Tax=Jannaschia sp. S6380 TaxID=2926408 RepID=UPI001FF181CB|nr:TetR/AcrR family transcriptional regulator [Jannaschia sp. S6380]MCK0167848.1 TetR/AcrR family transcriptional regulator [Jannaschia sp. S6380]